MVTVAEIAAYLGVTPSAVRHTIRRHGIRHVSTHWKAKLYDATEVLRHTGHHDRLATTDPMCHTHS